MSEGRKKRKKRQHTRELYAKIRHDLQLSGDLPTTPEGALRSEVVKTEDVPQPKLVEQALRRGWAVPEEKKPIIVDEMVKILEDPNLPIKVKVAAFNALRMADQQQYERDHPEQVSKLKANSATTQVNVNQTTNTVVQVGDVFSDIDKISERLGLVMDNEVHASADSDIRADGDAEPLDEEEPNSSQEEPEAN